MLGFDENIASNYLRVDTCGTPKTAEAPRRTERATEASIVRSREKTEKCKIHVKPTALYKDCQFAEK